MRNNNQQAVKFLYLIALLCVLPVALSAETRQSADSTPFLYSLPDEPSPAEQSEYEDESETADANTDLTGTPVEDSDSTDKPRTVFSILDTPQKTVSGSFENFVRSVDEFFADEKVFYETSGSYMRLTGEAIFREGGDQGYYSDLKVKVRLPTTQQKASLLLESDPTEEEEEIDKALKETPEEAVSDKDYFAGIQTTVGGKDGWKFKPSIGLRLGSSPDLYTRFRLTRKVPVSDGNFQFRQTLYWIDSSGWEADTSGEFNLPVAESLLFRSTTGANWQEETEETKLRQIFSLTQRLSERRSISYQTAFFGVNEPTTHTTNYLVSMHFRQILHEDYLFMGLIPAVNYHKDRDFQADYSLTLGIEMVFKR